MAKTEKKVFYSRSRGLRISMGKATRVIENGVSTLIEAGEIGFSPMGSDTWGMFATSDPVEIEFLETRMKNLGAGTDVFTAEQYREAVVPKEKQITKLQTELEAARAELLKSNALLAMLQKQQAPTPTPAVAPIAEQGHDACFGNGRRIDGPGAPSVGVCPVVDYPSSPAVPGPGQPQRK